MWGAPSLPDWHARVIGRSLGSASDKAVRQSRDLINAAARLMRRLDAEELTMQNIAAEAGVSVRVLYRHFEGKDDLLVALIEESQIVFARLIEKAAAGIADPLERLGEALYFATAEAGHQTDQNFSRAMARFTVQTVGDLPRPGQRRPPSGHLGPGRHGGRRDAVGADRGRRQRGGRVQSVGCLRGAPTECAPGKLPRVHDLRQASSFASACSAWGHTSHLVGRRS